MESIGTMLLQPMYVDYALLVARLALGLCFVVHAMGKLGLVGPGNMAGFAGWLKSMGLPFPEAQARAAMLCELVGGLLIAVGLFTRVGFVLAGSTMIVAATIGIRGGGYLITNPPPGNEYALNLAILCGVFFLLGPGALSLDAILF